VKGKYIQIINPGVYATQALGLTEDGIAHLWGQDETSNLKSSDVVDNHNIQSIYGIGDEEDAAFAALKYDGSIVSWGSGDAKSKFLAPKKDGLSPYTKIYSNHAAFAAITAEGEIRSWGDNECGGTSAPSGKDYIAIYSTYCSFVAVKADGTYSTWGRMGEKRGRLSPKTIMVTGTQKDVDNNLVEVSLKYNVSDGTSNIKDLALYLFFDSNKLEFMGIKDEGVLGLVNSSNQSPHENIVDPSTGFLKSWSSEYGEFQNLASWPDDDLNFTDGDPDSEQLVYLRWGHNPDYRYRTFEDRANVKGFIGDRILPVELLKKLYFKRKSSFVSGQTAVNLKIEETREGNLGAEHDVSWLEKAPLIIKANPNTSNTGESGG
jgi:hypothetical protein